MRKILFILVIGIWAIVMSTNDTKAVSLIIDGTDYIKNGSFESGSFSPGWEPPYGDHGFLGTGVGSQAVVYGAGYMDNYAALLGLLPGSAAQEPTGSDYMYQWVQPLPSSFTNITLTFAYRIVTEDTQPNDYFDVYLISVPPSGPGTYHLLNRYHIGVGVQGVSRDLGWQTAHFNVTNYLINMHGAIIGFRNYQNGNNYKTATYIDYVPEPCTIILLGTGLLSLAVYRRKKVK
jgi:hypothetical protein